LSVEGKSASEIVGVTDASKVRSCATLFSTITSKGVRIEAIEGPLMRDIRYLDKLVDELARGRPMERILRQ
jgi:hypothetical protein